MGKKSTDTEPSKNRSHFEWQERVAARADISPTYKVVLWRLALFRNVETGLCNPALSTLAETAGVSDRTAQRAITRAEKLQLLGVERSGSGYHHDRNRYHFLHEGVSLLTPVGVSAQSPVGVSTQSPERVSSRVGTGDRAATPKHVDNTKGEHAVTRAAPSGGGESPDQRYPVAPHPHDHDAAFEQFWRVYPKLVGKREAEREFKRALQQGATAEEIIAGARRYAVDPTRIKQSQGPDGERFTMNARNWLHDGRWTDKPTGVTIDQHGNAVAQPAQQNGGSRFLADVAAMYPNGRWQ